MKKIAYSLIIVYLLQGCTSQYTSTYASFIKTFLVSDIFKNNNYTTISYEGYAFNATLNEIPIIEISNKDKIKSLEGYRDLASVRWQLLRPINGQNMAVNLQRRRIKEHDIGKIRSYRIDYRPLTKVKLETKKIRVEDKTILVGGVPMVYYKDVVDSVPVGDYVISLTVIGTENWDRKEIYVEIREDVNVSKFL